MEMIYTRQSLLNLKDLRYIAVLDYMTKQRIKCLNINKKFRSKRGNRRNRHGTKSPCRPWDRNSGIHSDILKPTPASIKYTPSQYSSALLNVRSLSSNLLQIQHLLVISSLDILVLTETWTKQNQHLEVIMGTLSTMGYSLVAAHRPDRIGGGVAFIHKDILKVKRMDYGMSLSFKYLILELASRSIIAIIYCPPNSSMSTFLDEFTDWISHLLNKYIDHLILGDFNVNLAELGEPNSAAFLGCLKTNGLM